MGVGKDSGAGTVLVCSLALAPEEPRLVGRSLPPPPPPPEDCLEDDDESPVLEDMEDDLAEEVI